MIFFFYKYTKESCNAASTGRHPGPQLSTFLCNWPCDGKIFHFPFIVYYDPSIIFKIKKQTIFSMVWLSLLNYYHWMYLLSELCFAFLDCGHHHVTHTSSRKSIQSSLDPLHRDDIQIFGSYVVSTVDQGSKRKTQGSLEFHTRGPTTTLLRHLEHRKGTTTTKKLY